MATGRLRCSSGPQEIYGRSLIADTIACMDERRRSERLNLDLFFNKFLNGHPYLCRTLDVSPSGILATTFTEPTSQPDRFPVELRMPESNESIWLWAKSVRRSGHQQAMAFEKLGRKDRAKLHAQFLIGARKRTPAQSPTST